MGGRDAAVRRGGNPRPPRGAGPHRCGPCRPARPHGGGGPSGGSGRRCRAVDRAPRPDPRSERGGVARRPRAVSAARGRGSRRAQPRRLCGHPRAPARARPPWLRAPRPRRPSPRQHRPHRRGPGAVRRDRVRSADRGRRRALRPRLSAHGSGGARPCRRRQRGAQSLSRRDAPARGPRCARRAAVLSIAARRHPRQGDGRPPCPCRRGSAAGDRARGTHLFRSRRPPDRAPLPDPGRHRRAVRHRQIGPGARACAHARPRSRRRDPALRRRAQSPVWRGRDAASAGPCLRSGRDREGLCAPCRDGAPRHRGRPFGHRRCGVRARRRAPDNRGRGGAKPCGVPRIVPRRRCRDAGGARDSAADRCLRCRRRDCTGAGGLRHRAARLDRGGRLQRAGRDARRRQGRLVMSLDGRRIAVGLAGFCTFINLYMPQALLPSLAREFGVGATQISGIITASTLAIALTAPFTGALADVLGRKRVITAAMVMLIAPTVLVAFSASVPELMFWRFVQGLLLPPIFAVIVAYIGDEWPAPEVPGIAGLYVAGASLGGFAGRFVTGVLADVVGWRGAFLAIAGMTLASAAATAWLLPRERKFSPSDGLSASLKQMLRHLGNGQLVATYAVGFGVLFNFIAVFTYVSFHLAAPPYRFSASLLGAIFITYLVGTVISPMTGWMMSGLGRRRLILVVIALWIAGAMLMLAAPLGAMIVGLVLCAACGMLCQTISTGYVTTIAKEGRSSAVGLYVTSFYVGGSMGAFLPGLAWNSGGWPACVAMVVAMLAAMALIAALAYRNATA